MIHGYVNTKSSVSGVVNTAIPIGNKQIFSDTTANWNSQLELIGKKDCIYVYTDYKEEDGELIPALKVGDGHAFLIDLPFTFMGNITQEQIDFWNNKVTAYMDDVVDENLILSKL